LWLLEPLGAADCISRERREGTLGMLFLTPLKPAHIVIAKGLVHGLRAATLVVAVVPVLTIPFLLGGVAWQQVVLSVGMYFNATCWCLAAALVASALTRSTNRALALAVIFAGGGFLAFPWLVGILLGMNSQSSWSLGYSQSTYDFITGFSMVAMPAGNFNDLLRFIKVPQMVFVGGMAVLFSLAVLVFAVIFAANCIRRAWRDEPPSARAQQLERTFCRPVLWTGFLRRWMARMLERNPIGWLERRQWTGRMVTWAWFAIIVSLYSMAPTDRTFLRSSDGIERLLGWLLAVSMAVTAAGSFRRERETGVLELLLVSPLTIRQIIRGRLRGLWGQFLPAVGAYLGLRLYFSSLYYQLYSYATDRGELAEIWFFAITFLVTPVIGLYFSLACRHFISALVATLTFVFVVPVLLFVSLQFLIWVGAAEASIRGWLAEAWKVQWFFQGIIAVYLLSRLRRKLEQRTFALDRTVD
jgi:ABC-type transport system involved in multi-copper enzyme maturation permease subunit